MKSLKEKEYIIIIIIMCLICLYCFVLGYKIGTDNQQERRKNTNIYKTWVKLTGNPKKFTKEEFLILKKAGVLKIKENK